MWFGLIYFQDINNYIINNFTGNVPLVRELANFLCKEPDRKYFWLCRPCGLHLVLATQFCYYRVKAATDKQMNGPHCVPIKRYLRKLMSG